MLGLLEKYIDGHRLLLNFVFLASTVSRFCSIIFHSNMKISDLLNNLNLVKFVIVEHNLLLLNLVRFVIVVHN